MRNPGTITNIGTGINWIDSDYAKLEDNSYASADLELDTKIEDLVDQTSDLHAPSDVGYNTSFNEMQNIDLVYNILSEEDLGTAGTDINEFVGFETDSHLPAEAGTHSDFTEMQNGDLIYNTLEEEDIGTAGTNIYDFVGFETNSRLPVETGTHSLFANMQNKDSAFDVLREQNLGGAGVTEWLENDGDAGTLSNAAHIGSSLYLETVNGNNGKLDLQKSVITRHKHVKKWRSANSLKNFISQS